MADYNNSIDLTGEPSSAPAQSFEPMEGLTEENVDRQTFDQINEHIQSVLQNMKEKFQTMSEQILSKIDDMGSRIDDLEKNISDLMNHAGLETPDK